MITERSLKGKSALITGASSGIGKASALALAREGANVSLAARTKEKLEKLSKTINKKYGSKAIVTPTNIRDHVQVGKMVEKTVNELKKLDILVNNAGLACGKKVEETSIEEYKAIMETNVDGMFYATRKAIPFLRETNGNLIFIASFAGKFPRAFDPIYAATKWWTRGFAHSVEANLGKENIKVTVINPSEVRTKFGQTYGKSFKERYKESEVTEPEEVAEAVIFAAKQVNSTISELDIYRTDKFSNP